MLAECLRAKQAGLWTGGMPGVQACCFALDGPVQLTPALEPRCFEALFCRCGCLRLDRGQNRPRTVGEREILLLSDVSSLSGAWVAGRLEGVLVAVDANAAGDSLRALCALIGVTIDTGQIRQRMARWSGCAVLPAGAWSRAVFDGLDGLPQAEQGRYGVLKTVELLYLLCSRNNRLLPAAGPPEGDGMLRTIAGVRAYMEAHLGDRMTIAGLSRRFCLSQTALKTGFRHAYGMPLHRWLLTQRMRRAGELLRAPAGRRDMLRIAQAVGYDGVSQFYLAFKRYYGVTPGQYAKMPETGKDEPDCERQARPPSVY